MDVSIVVPTYNRPAQLARCLRSMTELDFDGQFEVILVDDGGNTDLQDVIEAVSDDLVVTLITAEHAGPSQARNEGVLAARGRAIALTDDDCTFNRNWLNSMWRHFEQQPDDMLGGHTANALENNVYASASQLLVGYVCNYYSRKPESGYFFTSNNLFLSRQKFLDVGGFDARFKSAGGEDREFCDRWRHSGMNLKYVEEAIVMHHHDLTLRGFMRQHYNYGHGALLYHQCRRQRQGARLAVEPFSFYWNLLAEAWRSGARRPMTQAALLVASQAANAAGLMMAKLKPGVTPEAVKP